ncbi:hypothetical protein M3Y94_00229000 [Aphelenchoides besseyi]|nr:hypothetical protein M3Y94_00229000 [Aphelenchoides besseyi]
MSHPAIGGADNHQQHTKGTSGFRGLFSKLRKPSEHVTNQTFTEEYHNLNALLSIQGNFTTRKLST